MTLVRNHFLKVAFLALVATAGCELYQEPTPPTDRVHFPISVAVHPTGDYVYAVNSNFDTRYKERWGGTVSVINADTGQINAQGSPRMPSFGGIIQLNQTGTKAYIPSRFNDSVTVFDVAPDGSALSCPGSEPESCEISQLPGNGDVKGPKIAGSPYDIAVDTTFKSATIRGLKPNDTVVFNTPTLPTQNISGTPTQIATNISAISGIHAQYNGGNLVITTTPTATDPTGATVRVFPTGDHQSVTYDANDTAYVTSQQSNRISTLFLPGQSLSNVSMVSTDLDSDTGGIAKRPHSKDVVAVQRRGPNMVVFQPVYNRDGSALNAIFRITDIVLNHRASNIYGRGIAFNPSGDTAYVISQVPNVLYILRIVKTLVDDPVRTVGVAEHYVLEAAVPLKESPVSIVYHPTPSGGRLYIPCTISKSIVVVDAISGAVVDEIQLGDTPSNFAINEPRCLDDMTKCVGYVALFDDTPNGEDTCSTAVAGQCGSIAVVDLNPASFNYHQVIRKFE